MKMTLTELQFVIRMMKSEYNPFSSEALVLLFNHFRNYEESTGEEIEFDPIAIRCEYEEMPPSELILTYRDLEEELPDHFFLMINRELTQDHYKEMHPTIEAFLIDRTDYVGITEGGNYVFGKF
jgi:hypothetical protein